MSVGGRPDAEVSVGLDARWIVLPVRGEQESTAWAQDAVDQALAVREVAVSGAARQLYVHTYVRLLESMRVRRFEPDREMAGAFALVSTEDLLPASVAEIWAVPMSEGSHEDLLEALVVPAGDRFGDPIVTEVETGAGTALRLKQLLVLHGADGGSWVETSVLHLWPGPTPASALLLSTYFGSAVDAEVYAEVYDELARSVEFAVRT